MISLGLLDYRPKLLILTAKIVTRSRNYFCHGKAISITYSECVFVASGSQHAPYFHLWPARFYNILPHYLINGEIFEKKKCFSLQFLSKYSPL